MNGNQTNSILFRSSQIWKLFKSSRTFVYFATYYLELVSFNMGITILPQSSMNEITVRNKGIKVLPLIDQQVHWQIGIAWRKGSYISLATRTWINFLKEKLEKNEIDT